MVWRDFPDNAVPAPWTPHKFLAVELMQAPGTCTVVEADCQGLLYTAVLLSKPMISPAFACLAPLVSLSQPGTMASLAAGVSCPTAYHHRQGLTDDQRGWAHDTRAFDVSG